MADPANPFMKYVTPQAGGDDVNPFMKYVADPKQTASAPEPMAWGDVASQAVSNIPSSAYNLAAGIGHMVAHPIDTAQGLYNVGKGAVSKVEGAIGVQQDDPAQKATDEAGINALRDFYANRYGSMEGFKKALASDPVGVAGDLSAAFTGPELALAKAPGALGRAGEISGRIAEASNPVTMPFKVASKVVEPVVSNVLGMTTGVGATPIRQAAQAGAEGSQTFLANMRGNAQGSDVVDMAKSAMGQMRKDRSDAYKTNMAGVNADKTQLYFNDIYDAINDAQSIPSFKGLVKSDSAASTLQKIKDKVDEWHQAAPAGTTPGPNGSRVAISPYRTAEGIDALKQAIGDIRDDTKFGTQARVVADKVYNAAKNTIVKQDPTYASAMSDYANASDKINEATKTFSLGDKASQDTSLRKLQSVMRNNVNTNYGQRTQLMNELAQYEPDLPNALAGQTMSSATPRGLASLGAISLGGSGVVMHGLSALNPATLAMLPAFSPRVVGEAAYKAGQFGNALTSSAPVNALMPLAKALPPAARAAFIMNALAHPGLTGGMGPRYDDNGNRRPGQ